MQKPEPKPVKLLIHDWDGTLFNTDEARYQCHLRVCEHIGRDKPSFKDFLEHEDAPTPEYYVRRELTKRHAYDEINQVWYKHWSPGASAFYPAVPLVLQAIRDLDHGCVQMIVSGSEKKYIEEQLERANIRTCIARIVGSVSFGKKSVVFRELATHYGVTRTAIFGDLPDDLRAAKEAGIEATAAHIGVHVRESVMALKPMYHIAQHAELVNLVKYHR